MYIVDKKTSMFVPYVLNTLYKMFVRPWGCLNNVFVFSMCIRIYFLYIVIENRWVFIDWLSNCSHTEIC